MMHKGLCGLSNFIGSVDVLTLFNRRCRQSMGLQAGKTANFCCAKSSDTVEKDSVKIIVILQLE